MPCRPRFMFACFSRSTRHQDMQKLLDSITFSWPDDYYPAREDYSAVGRVLFVLIWQSWAVLAGILITIIATIIHERTKEWQYPMALGVFGWLPCCLLGIVLFWALVRLALSFWAELLSHGAQRETRRLYRRQERRRERRTHRMQLREFNAALFALVVLGADGFTEHFALVDLEVDQGSRPVSAGTSSSSGMSNSSATSSASS